MRRITILLAAASAAAVVAVIPSTGAGDDAPVHPHATISPGPSRELASEIARARIALAPFATDLDRAKALQLLAPRPGHAAPLAVVPEPRGGLQQHQPARRPLQPGLRDG